VTEGDPASPAPAEPFEADRTPLRGRVLVVDDDAGVRELLVRLLGVTGHAVETAQTAEEGLEKVRANPPDLILLDMQLPDRSGFDVLGEVRAEAHTRLIPVVMMTGAGTPKRKLKAIEAGATDFLSKPFSMVEMSARVRALLELKFATDALEAAGDVIVTLAQAIDARDPYTYGHSARVSFYATLLGERVGLQGPPLEAVRHGGLFHDFGKLAVRDRVLLKPGRLTETEYAEIRVHPRKGGDLLQKMKTLAPSLAIVYHHHERMDGSGYPDGLTGESIPLSARITTIADVFDALTTARVYRGALPRAEAIRIMREEVRKGWWDGRLLAEFLGVLETLPERDPRLLALAAPEQVPDTGP
jgi:putative two-component system response regulator